MFASVGTALKLHFWNKHHLETVSTYKPKKSSYQKITDVSWSYDNTYILVLQEQNQPQIVSTRDRSNVSLIHTIQAVKNVTATSFENHTKRLLGLGSKEGNVVLYDTKNRIVTKKVASLDSPICFLEFNLMDDQIAIATDDKLVIYFDNDRINDFTKEIEVLEPPSSVKFHPNTPNLMVVGKMNGEVMIRDNDKGEIVSNFQKHSSAVTGVTFLGGQKTIITTGLDHKICMYDYSSQENVFRINVQQQVTSLDISSSEFIFAVGMENGCIFIYDVRQPLKPLASTNAQDGPISKLSFEKGSLCFDPVSERTSFTTLNDTDYSDNRENNCMGDVEKLEKPNEEVKKEMLKTVRSHMSYLENQLAEHCSKFQAFVNSEFDAIHNTMARWEVFKVGEGSEIGHLESDGAKSTKSSYIYRSNI